MQHVTHVAFLDLLFIISGTQESQSHTVSTQRRLDNIRNVFSLLLIVKVAHILSGHFLMTAQVIVGTVCDTPQLAPAEREEELDIGSCLRVERQFFFLMVTNPHFLVFDTQLFQPVHTVIFPVSEPFQICIRFAEELQLHLLELSGTESKVTRRNLVTEGLTDLSDTERNFLSGSSLYIFKVDKNTLGSLRTKVYRVLRVLGNTLEGLEHQVELTDVGKIMLTAAWTRHIVLVDKRLHLLLAPAVDG